MCKAETQERRWQCAGTRTSVLGKIRRQWQSTATGSHARVHHEPAHAHTIATLGGTPSSARRCCCCCCHCCCFVPCKWSWSSACLDTGGQCCIAADTDAAEPDAVSVAAAAVAAAAAAAAVTHSSSDGM
eukprot:43302-Chlamydomonas_euryale.AAC.2